ncbi:MAG TPA: sporulation protein YabP [Candidatus Faecousia intestinigallinarum]|nr:sporulation protein YabP [Candidatus Faecousia intestinigallinarum]
MGDEKPRLPHKLTLTERSSLTMTGVTEVLSFDETAVILHTSLGTLVIQGEGLQLKQLSLDGGQVAVEGKVTAFSYEEPRPAGSFLRRLFG